MSDVKARGYVDTHTLDKCALTAIYPRAFAFMAQEKAMKPSRAVTRAGLFLTVVAGRFTSTSPRIALVLANAGDRISAAGVRMACYGH